jgi:hypothetical protein
LNGALVKSWHKSFRLAGWQSVKATLPLASYDISLTMWDWVSGTYSLWCWVFQLAQPLACKKCSAARILECAPVKNLKRLYDME